jgi:hypothetical protein
MRNSVVHVTALQCADTNTYTFVKKENRWFLSLPYRKEANRIMNELIEGTQSLLNTLARGADKLCLTMDTQPFEGAERLQLVELCDRGGAYYYMDTCNGKRVNKKMWLCDLTLLLFGDMPEGVYFRKEAEVSF